MYLKLCKLAESKTKTCKANQLSKTTSLIMPAKKSILKPLALPKNSEKLVQLVLEAFRAGKYTSLHQAAVEHNAPCETVRQ